MSTKNNKKKKQSLEKNRIAWKTITKSTLRKVTEIIHRN